MENNKREILDTRLADEILANVEADAEGAQEETAKAETPATSRKATRESVNAKKNISRRGLLGGVAAVVVGAGGAAAIPLLTTQAEEAQPATKDDIASLEYELSQLSKASSDAELVSHKSLKVDENSTDVEYPSSKAVYNALTDKIGMDQGVENAGLVFIVGTDGKITLSKFTSDELSAESTLPVENRVVYKAIKDINDALNNLDSVPQKDSKHGVESGGVYKTYQETEEITSFGGCVNGVNYKYSGTAIKGSDGVYSVKMVDNVLFAISQDDPSIVYTSADNGVTWGAPYGGW